MQPGFTITNRSISLNSATNYHSALFFKKSKMKKKITARYIGLIAVLFSVVSCEEMMVGEPGHSSNENNFRLMWNEFDTHYGLFLVKDIDWNAVYAAHLPKAKAAENDQELFSILSSALSIMNDKHVNIYTNKPDLADYNSGHHGSIPGQEDFLFDVVKDNYLIEYEEVAEGFGYGKLTDHIGYIHISKFDDNLSVFKKGMDKALKNLGLTQKIIFDIRDHQGGSDNVSKYIAGRFASSKKLFMTSKKRNGPGHNDFEEVIKWYVEPEGSTQYTNPVILLTTSTTISAGESFTLAMRENDNVKHVGEKTAGAFSDTVPFQLLNGWLVTIGVGDYRASDGKSYEGVGIAPHQVSKNNKVDVLNGIDKTLEFAIDL
jgi:carboxyl-terminal processing protease